MFIMTMKECWDEVAASLCSATGVQRSSKACREKYKQLEELFKKGFFVWSPSLVEIVYCYMGLSHSQWIYYPSCCAIFPSVMIAQKQVS